MIIYNNNGVPIIDVEVDDSSYRYRQIMGRDEVLLEFSLAEHVELPVGAYLVFENDRYDLLKEENVTVNHSRNYEYKITFSGPGERARNYIIHNIIDKRLKFDLTARPSDHLAMIVANMNERDGAGVWSVGTCIDKKEMTISYNHTYCIDGLSQLADECDTEYEIVRLSGSTYAINLGKVEYYKSNPLSLGYGKENGFVPGVSRESSSASLEKVWIEGGDKNISLKSYGASLLHLPENLSFSFDGSKFSGETGYDRTKGVSMSTDAEGYSVELASAAANATEGSLDVTGIYPKRVGKVTSLRFEYNNWYYTYEELIEAFPSLSDEDWESVQIDIVDNTIPASLDYAECLMVNDQPLTVIFQSGPLAGREFDATFQKESRTDTRTVDDETETVTRPANRFELKKADHDGVNMPTRNYLPATDNEYVVVNCIMPEAYVSDPDSFGGAEYDALREAAAYLYENKDKTRSYRGTIDGLFAKRNWLNVSSHLKLGSYVSFSHPQVQAAPIAVRILACKQYINKPHKPEIEISNEIVSVGKSTTIQEAVNQQAHVEALNNAARRFSRRGFRDAKETAEMLIGAALEGFDPAISPIAIQTMQLLAGDESLQFKFWTSRACVTPVSNPVWYDPDAKVLHVDSCCLQHMTLGIGSMSPSHDLDEYLIWNMDEYESAVLAEPSKRYYVYAKVDALNDGETHLSGTFEMSETAIGMRSVEGYYYLLVGMLMSENDNDRSFAPMFGFTEILPGQITTDIIRSSGGSSFLDLVNNQFVVGNNVKGIEWNKNNDGILRIKGALNVSPSGDTFPTIVPRGEYDPTETYNWGDLVTYNGSSYLFISETSARGKNPETETTYWQIYVEKGKVQFKSIVFTRTNSTPATPTGGSYESPVPSGWSDGVPSGEQQLWMSTNIFSSDGTSEGWTTPQPVTDTADIDFEFSAVESNPGTPTTNPSNWHNTATASDIWMAVRKCKNGIWGSWEVSKIKGEKGADAEPIRVQYSANGTSWHDNYQSGDEYMRIYSQGSWGSAVKIKGEQGLIGPDGQKAPYHDFMFGISAYTSASGEPSDITAWSDTPPTTTSSKPYLWCRDRYYTVNSSNQWVLYSTRYYRLTGEAGADGTISKFQWAKKSDSSTPATGDWVNTYPSSIAGYYIWQRQAVYVSGVWHVLDGNYEYPANSGEYPNTVGIIHDPTAYEAENTSKEEIAKKLGYTDWTAFEQAVAAKQVIIQGGMINAELIDVSLLVASIMATGLAGKRVELSGNQISVKDANNNTVISINGDSIYLSPAAFAAAGSSTSKSISYSSSSDTVYGQPGNVDVRWDKDYHTIGSSITLPSVSCLRGITLYVGLSISTSYLSEIASQGGRVQLALISSDDRVYSLGMVDFASITNGTKMALTIPDSAPLPKGTYTFAVKGSGYLKCRSSSTVSINLNPTITVSSSRTSSSSWTASFYPINEGVELFSNGFGYKIDPYNYFAAVNPGNGQMVWGVQRGGGSSAYGIEVNASGITANFGGSTYVPLMPIFAHAKVLYRSTAGACTVYGWHRLGGTITATQTGSGTSSSAYFTVNIPNLPANATILITTNHGVAGSAYIADALQSGTSITVKLHGASNNANTYAENFSILILV